MQPVYEKNKVFENIEISPGIYRLSIEGRFSGNAGQFYMLRCWKNDPILSRPISIHDMDDNRIVFLFEARGYGTKLLSSLKPGDSIDMLGPLGNGFDTDNIQGKVAIVTGGIGIAPMLFASKKIKKASADLYAGFRDNSYVLDSLKEYVENIHVATDSGREGTKGFVTDIFSPASYSLVLCCGPEAMMEKVAKMCLEADVPVYMSMERHMACGIGACLVCTCGTKDGNKRVCKDGPVFSGRDVIYDA